jgi:hypothetical protein
VITKIPSGLDEIIATFGSLSDPNFESRNIAGFELPYQLTYAGHPMTRARCHRLAADNFVQAFKNVQDAGQASAFTEFNGIYARRPIRGQTSHASCHSWGIAIDMEASQYALGSNKRMPDSIINAFRAAGFFYGGDFVSRHDPMHFQLATHY